jgi:peptidylprolyl isomerase
MRTHLSIPLFLIGCLSAHENPRTVSESLGHLIGKNLQTLGLPLDFDALVKGLKDESEGKDSPLSEEECVQAIATLQEESLSLKGEKNLQEAALFLKKNEEKEGIVSLEEGKLQYEVIQSGKGDAVQAYNTPLVRCKGRFLNGETFGSGSEEDLICLDEAIAGFSKGIVGMQEGEKRILYIHPELGYGKQQHLNPNALLIFEVELVKADASPDAHAASSLETRPVSDAIETSPAQ